MSNGKTTKRYGYDTSFQAYLAEQMKKPEFAKAYHELDAEFALIVQLIDLRLRRGLTQAQLAERVGTKQPSIARMETTRQARNLGFLGRVAEALDARLELRLVPKETKAAQASGAQRKRTMSATAKRAGRK